MNKKEIILVFALIFFVLMLFQLVSAYNLLCLENGQTVRFSQCNSAIQDRTCTSDSGCQFCVSRTSSGAYCPASINACNTEGLSCTALEANNSDINTTVNAYFIINSLSPNEGYSKNGTSSIQFKFTVTKSTNMTRCNLILNDQSVAINSTRISSTTNIITYLVQPGQYLWEINCTDKGNITGSSPSRHLTIFSNSTNSTNSTQPPQNQSYFNVTLVSPSDNYKRTGSITQSFSYKVTSSSNISQCNLIVNDQLVGSNVTKISSITNIIKYYITPSPYSYKWYVSCADKNNIVSNSTPRAMQVDSRSVSFTTSILSPEQNFSSNDTNVKFIYNVSNNASIKSCELMVNNKSITLDSSSILTGNNSFDYTITPGEYSWSVLCRDSLANYASSSSRIFTIETISEPEPQPETGNGGGGSGGGGSSGGGGGSSSSSVIKKPVNATATNQSQSSSTGKPLNETETSENGNQQTSGITGAAIGTAIKKNIIPIVVFLVIIVGAWGGIKFKLFNKFKNSKTPTPGK